MKNFKLSFFLIINLFLTLFIVNATIYNQDGDFSINIVSLNKQIYNDNIQTNFTFSIKNNKLNNQNFKLIVPTVNGWNINSNKNSFSLNNGNSNEISLEFTANNNFDYSNNVVSSNVIQISQKENYKGSFNFPITIIGDKENISLNLVINIDKKQIKPISFKAKLSTQKLSPNLPLRYSINGENINTKTDVFIRLEIGNTIVKEFSDSFTKKNNFKFFQQEISNDFKPGDYNGKITIRIPQDNGKVIEWSESSKLEIIENKNILVSKINSNSFFKEKYSISIKNNGNLDSKYLESINLSYFKILLLSSNVNYEKNQNGILFNISLNKGDSKTIDYSINYLPIYIILIVLIIMFSYIIIRKNSNPLDVENKIYEIKNVVHEGVKSMKIRIGFENIKEHEIEDLKVIFRMPAYLNIKENSFSLTEPNHVLKGRKQFKLIWNFRKFEKDDSRILGFGLINSRGILGDIKLPDLEFEVKINGKIRKYYKSFPVIRGWI